MQNVLGFHYLESGAIYRALGLWVHKNQVGDTPDVSRLLELIDSMRLEFRGGNVWLNSEDVTTLLREEFVGMLASKYSAIGEVRARLLQFQRDFAIAPVWLQTGVIWESVVFPNADLKVFLTASAEKSRKAL